MKTQVNALCAGLPKPFKVWHRNSPICHWRHGFKP